METFNFEEALSFLRAGMQVCDEANRIYVIKDGELICYPDYKNKPNFRRFVMSFKADWILNEKWHLYDTESI